MEAIINAMSKSRVVFQLMLRYSEVLGLGIAISNREYVSWDMISQNEVTDVMKNLSTYMNGICNMGLNIFDYFLYSIINRTNNIVNKNDLQIKYISYCINRISSIIMNSTSNRLGN